MTTINRAIAQSMAAQLDRVNGSPAKLIERIVELEAENNRLRAALRQNNDQRDDWHGKRLNGRPVLTIAEAAQKAGVSYFVAYRYVTKHDYWQADQTDSGDWLVYADQPLARKPAKKKAKKK
jgi:hypothetical protein